MYWALLVNFMIFPFPFLQEIYISAQSQDDLGKDGLDLALLWSHPSDHFLGINSNIWLSSPNSGI